MTERIDLGLAGLILHLDERQALQLVAGTASAPTEIIEVITAEVAALVRSRREPGPISVRVADEAWVARWAPAGSSTIVAAVPAPASLIADSELTEELLRAQRMEAVARLASIAAHDFSNALTTIQGHVARLTARVTRPDVADDLAQMQRAVDGAGHLVEQLLALSRHGAVENNTPFDLSEVQRMVPRLARVLPPDIDLRLIAEPGGTPTVLVDPERLETTLLNLVVNARDAMTGRGEIRLRLDWLSPEAGPGDGAGLARLRVEDDGVGMSPETAAHAFEPFFTTKPRGRGTGLGLSSAYGFAARCRGSIQLTSALGEGTTVTLLLPALDAPRSRATSSVTRQASEAGTAEILLVEDDSGVRGLLSSVLVDAGYRVHWAVDGPTAIELVESGRASPDLLVCDVVLPGLRGPALVQRLVSMAPELRVLFISGYPAESLDDLARERVRHRFLAKPFMPSQLLAEIAAILRGETV